MNLVLVNRPEIFRTRSGTWGYVVEGRAEVGFLTKEAAREAVWKRRRLWDQLKDDVAARVEAPDDADRHAILNERGA